MYAVIETGGKQYRVELGAEIQVDRMDARPGDAIMLDRVLLVADGEATAVGQPLVDGASVAAEVLRQERGEKIVVFKYKPKARTRVKQGHRAELTTLRIADIAFGGKSAAHEARETESKKSKALREAERQAEMKAAADRELAAKLAAATAPERAEPEMSEPETAAPKRTTKRTSTPSDETAATTPTVLEEPAVEADPALTPTAHKSARTTRTAVEPAAATDSDTTSTPADGGSEAGLEAAGTDTKKDE